MEERKSYFGVAGEAERLVQPAGDSGRLSGRLTGEPAAGEATPLSSLRLSLCSQMKEKRGIDRQRERKT
mgnify:CR=1 FL=1